MGQSSLTNNQDFNICDSCDAEFLVTSAYEDDEAIIFCPYCGTPLNDDESFDDSDDEEYDQDHRN